MIHIEGDWYIRVDGYKCYVLGRKSQYTLKSGKKEEKLTDCLYFPDLAEAVKAYTEVAVANSLKDEEIELVDALRKATEEYDRHIERVKRAMSAPLD